MKKRLLAGLLSLAMVLTMLPAAAFAADDPPEETPPVESCICTELCTEETVNWGCLVCGGEGGYAACTYTAPQKESVEEAGLDEEAPPEEEPPFIFMDEEARTGGETWMEFAASGDIPAGYQVDEGGRITITSAEGLAWLAYQVNEMGETYAGKTVALGDNISLSEREWVPIGYDRTYPRPGFEETDGPCNWFEGAFDGRDHTISDMTITEYHDPQHELAGLFGFTIGAEIKDLRLEDAEITLDLTNYSSEGISKIRSAGLLVSWAIGTRVDDVTVSGDLDVTLESCYMFAGFGGIAGIVDAVVGAQPATVPLPDEGKGSAFTGCTAEDLQITYNGSSGFLYYPPDCFGGVIGMQGLPRYLVDIHLGTPASNWQYGTTLQDCLAQDITITRKNSGGSPYEAVSGLVGATHYQASITDCSVEGLTADMAGKFRNDPIFSNLYMGGIVGIFDGKSEILRCTVQGEITSDIAGGDGSVDTDKTGGFYGGVAGMIGYPPEESGSYPFITRTYEGTGGDIKSCYVDMDYGMRQDESARHIASARSVAKDATITVSHNICHNSGLTVTNDYQDKPVCGWLNGGNGNQTTSYIQNHPVEPLVLYVGEAAEPFKYTYSPPYSTQILDSLTDNGGSSLFDKIEDLNRAYTADKDVLLSGCGTAALTFAQAGTYDVTVIITDPGDSDVFVTFTPPVQVIDRPVDLDGSLEIQHSLDGTEWDRDDTEPHLLESANAEVSYQASFNFTEMTYHEEDGIESSGSDIWDYYLEYYSYFGGTELSVRWTFSPDFVYDETSSLALNSNVLSISGTPAYDAETHTLSIPCSMTTEKVQNASHEGRGFRDTGTGIFRNLHEVHGGGHLLAGEETRRNDHRHPYGSGGLHRRRFSAREFLPCGTVPNHRKGR
ncbi:hypothetical protein [Dysosmobacter sp.]|uniref:hypothetical protein n=1 Tax=Dysosmobacter sp. TaxID=2591382 RepID=UPI003AEF5A70